MVDVNGILISDEAYSLMPMLNCKCGKCKNEINPVFLYLVDSQIRHVREVLGRKTFSPFFTCGARCEKHNKDVGGAENSAHLVGMAGDQVFRSIFEFDWIVSWIYETRVQRKIFYLGRKFIHWDFAYNTPVPHPHEWIKVYPEYFNIIP